MPGVKTGTGCVVGSGAVVTKDIPPYSVAVGVPARVIKMRFKKDIVEKLMDISWWNWEREKLEKCFNEFLNINDFLEKNYIIEKLN